MQVTQDACVAFLKADLAAAEALLAPGFTLVNSSAVVQTREEVLAEMELLPSRNTLVESLTDEVERLRQYIERMESRG